MTGYGSSYAFNSPYLGSPETEGNDTCVNQSTVPYACVGLSAVADDLRNSPGAINEIPRSPDPVSSLV
jgi:hypothetical protein